MIDLVLVLAHVLLARNIKMKLTREPNVQAKVRQEINEVIGNDREAKLTDGEHMPFTEATIMEIQRMGNIGKKNIIN